MNIPASELLDLALKGSLVLGAATLLSLTLRKASAALRHLVWFVGVLGILAPPLASARLNSLEVSWFPRWETEPEQAMGSTAPASPAPTPIVFPTTPTEMATMPIAPAPISMMPIEAPSTNWPAVLWVTGSIICMLPYGFGLLRLWRTTRLASTIHPDLQPDVEYAMGQLALFRRIEVRIGNSVRMPMTWGLSILSCCSRRNFPTGRSAAAAWYCCTNWRT
ncbi:MAG: hypothetical protein ACPGVU_06055 [Limisphaerales bacterium]